MWFSYFLIRLNNDLILVLNDVDKKRLEIKGIPAKNIYVTSGGVDHEGGGGFHGAGLLNSHSAQAVDAVRPIPRRRGGVGG